MTPNGGPVRTLLKRDPTGGQPLQPVEQRALFAALACPKTKQRLSRVGDRLVSEDSAHSYEIVREIPRFVSSDSYVRSFSFEWNVHNQTQLDLYRKDGMSERVLREKTGLTPEQVRGKVVLDAGVGAGRFTEVLSRWGALVVGVDLSYAVEAAGQTFSHAPNVLICQADIAHLPFRPQTFDYIISIGVLHHTPETRRYFNYLPPLLKPGGEIAIWLYPNENSYLTVRQWIPFTHWLPARWYYSFCKVFVPYALQRRTNRFFHWLGPVFPISDQGLGIENDILNTFDAYSPRFYHTHSPAEVKTWFHEAGLADICDYDFHTAVRGRRAA
jgi:SAM-dependent methyltransferase